MSTNTVSQLKALIAGMAKSESEALAEIAQELLYDVIDKAALTELSEVIPAKLAGKTSGKVLRYLLVYSDKMKSLATSFSGDKKSVTAKVIARIKAYILLSDSLNIFDLMTVASHKIAMAKASDKKGATVDKANSKGAIKENASATKQAA